MAEFSKLNGYDVKDATARANISNHEKRLSLLDNKKYIIIGDSYCQGYTPDGNVTGWGDRVKSYLGLSDKNCTIKYHGGASFSNPDNNFITLLNAIPDDEEVTDVIVGGGYNDSVAIYTFDDLFNGIVDFKTAANTKFPNAKVHAMFVGNTNNPDKKDLINRTYIRYKETCNQYGIAFYENLVFTLHDYTLFSSDGYHPNNQGNITIARNVIQCLLTGTCSVRNRDIPLTITYPDGFGTSGLQFSTSLNNDQMYVGIHSNYHIRPNAMDMTFDGNNFYELGTIASGNISGCGASTYYNAMECTVIMQDANYKFYNVPVKFLIKNNKLIINGYAVNSDGNAYLSLTGVRDIQIGVNSWLLDTWKC